MIVVYVAGCVRNNSIDHSGRSAERHKADTSAVFPDYTEISSDDDEGDDDGNDNETGELDSESPDEDENETRTGAKTRMRAKMTTPVRTELKTAASPPLCSEQQRVVDLLPSPGATSSTPAQRDAARHRCSKPSRPPSGPKASRFVS